MVGIRGSGRCGQSLFLRSSPQLARDSPSVLPEAQEAPLGTVASKIATEGCPAGAKRPPVVVVSAPRSGEGKTTVALGIMAAFRRRGLQIQGFKAGPDYLDTGYQALATGRPGRNLDLWMMGREAVECTVALSGDSADLIVIEGAMGLFDGHRYGNPPTSTADLAILLEAPVVLVMDAAHAAASLGALAHGFRTFDERVQLAGVILNRWATHRDRRAVAAALARAQVEIFGYVPTAPEAELPSRHLGLVMVEELAGEAEQLIEVLASLIESQVDLDGLLRLASGGPRGEGPASMRCLGQDQGVFSVVEPAAGGQPRTRQGSMPTTRVTGPIFSERRCRYGYKPRIAVALDSAFAFYYQDNLDAIERAGGVVVPFSPLQGQALPLCDGLYLGGGYPELHAEALSANQAMRRSIRSAAAAGLPVYAECGGLLYLCETLEDVGGRKVELVGVVPGQVVMRERLQSVGYREGRLACNCLLGHAGDVLRGHEFHYSECLIDRDRLIGSAPAYLLDGHPEGFAKGDLFASYVHLHFAGCPGVVRHLLGRCEAYHRTQSREKTAEQSEGSE